MLTIVVLLNHILTLYILHCHLVFRTLEAWLKEKGGEKKKPLKLCFTGFYLFIF